MYDTYKGASWAEFRKNELTLFVTVNLVGRLQGIFS